MRASIPHLLPARSKASRKNVGRGIARRKLLNLTSELWCPSDLRRVCDLDPEEGLRQIVCGHTPIQKRVIPRDYRTKAFPVDEIGRAEQLVVQSGQGWYRKLQRRGLHN